MQGTGLIIFPLLILYKNIIKKKINPSNKIKNRKSRFRVDWNIILEPFFL